MTGSGTSPTRSVAWSKPDPLGAEHAGIELRAASLNARGVAIGSDPEAYRLDFALETGDRFVTSRLEVTTRGEGWRRRIEVGRADSGAWSVEASAEGKLDLPPPGGGMDRFEEALDVDLGLSPTTNSMPVLRQGLLDGGESPELLMVWVSVPDLAIRPSRQRYTSLRALEGGVRLIRFEELYPDEEDFVAEIAFDSDGVVIDYPGIATRIRAQSPDQ